MCFYPTHPRSADNALPLRLAGKCGGFRYAANSLVCVYATTRLRTSHHCSFSLVCLITVCRRSALALTHAVCRAPGTFRAAAASIVSMGARISLLSLSPLLPLTLCLTAKFPGAILIKRRRTEMTHASTPMRTAVVGGKFPRIWIRQPPPPLPLTQINFRPPRRPAEGLCFQHAVRQKAPQGRGQAAREDDKL